MPPLRRKPASFKPHGILRLVAYFFFLSLLFTQTAAWAAVLLSADEQFRFAEECFAKEDYAIAAVEFKRFVFLFPDDHRVATAGYKTGLSFFRAGNYREVIRFFHQFQETYGDTEYTRAGGFLTAHAYLALGQKGDAVVTLNNLVVWTEDRATRDLAYYELGWILLEQPSYRLSLVENERNAFRYFDRISPGGADTLLIPALKDELQKYDTLSEKNPAVAGGLSIIPGLGQLYCGRYQDSLTAFVLNAALGYAAYEAFDHENYALGGIISMVGLGFYAGNIYGAVTSAYKYNRGQRSSFIQAVKQNDNIQIPDRMKEKRLGIVFQSSF